MKIFDLQRFRTEKNLTQIELAELLDCKQPFISAVEKGERQLSEDKLLILSQKYSDITDYIITTPDVVQSNQHGDNINGKTVNLANDVSDKFLKIIIEQSKQISKSQEQIDRLISIIEKK